MKKVIVGLSGGVDSSVAAYLLKQQGYDVHAVYMINWHDTEGLRSGDCPATEEKLVAELVARKLDIPFQVVDFSKEYHQRVVDYMFAEYEKGRTPNPDVLCNREIKFDPFLKLAEEMQADFIATGHYCRKETITKDGKEYHRLLAGSDPNKDQSYFLCQLSQDQLAKTLFPIGDIIKPEVRRIADEQGLASAHRKDSQGICFVGKVDLPTFLQQKLKASNGDIIEIPASYPYPDYSDYDMNIAIKLPSEDLRKLTADYSYKPEDGNIVGQHIGAQFYTIGQRKGLNVGGKAEPLFVINTDIEQNIVYTGMGHSHTGLNRPGLFIGKDEIHYVRPDLAMEIGETRHYDLRIRYRQPLQKAVISMREEGMFILFENLQRGIASGQFAAWYDGEELIGSGVIA